MDLKERLDRFTENTQLRYMAAGLLIVLGLVLIAGGQLGPQPQESRESPVNDSEPFEDITSVRAIEVNLTINYSNSVQSELSVFQRGTTVFQALNTTQNVSYQTSEYGYFITSINNVSGTTDQYWTYTVNGESAEVGAGQYSLTESANVTFTLS